MNVQCHYEDPALFELDDSCIFVAPDGAMRPYAKTAEFFRESGNSPEMRHGRTLALYRVSSPHDVHYPIWEIHPEGDELLIVVSGSLSVDLREGEKERTAPLPPQAAFIVRAGVRHRLIVHEPSVLIAITPRHNTIHEES
jgi:mannose-6-phosphate isomerase-like protein (cupin superfamily)